MAFGAKIAVIVGIPGVVGSRPCSILSRRFIDNGNEWQNLSIQRELGKVLCRAVGSVGSNPVWFQPEAFVGAVNHASGCADFSGLDGTAGLDIDKAFYYTKNIHTMNAWPDTAEIYTQTSNLALPFSDDALPVQESDSKNMLANALLRLYQPRRFDAVVDLVRDPRNGHTRIMLLEPLLRVRNRRAGAMEILKELMADPILETELSERGVG
ncbi:hypothetical protein [uncultured Tateyamaria sp.]|uniref:hypothetical protein n=1 Tax=uncultured Tateyamaria sp. TaxID=455651 RepID=UPI00260DD509|nr:hypothetical protein [uncultured Tateyamaria sp.]